MPGLSLFEALSNRMANVILNAVRATRRIPPSHAGLKKVRNSYL
jgi:hypothetical protein